MKVFVEKHVKENETMTKTSKLIGLLIKTCILPIKVSDNREGLKNKKKKSMEFSITGRGGLPHSTLFLLSIFRQ